MLFNPYRFQFIRVSVIETRFTNLNTELCTTFKNSIQSNAFPTYEDLIKFVTERTRATELIHASHL